MPEVQASINSNKRRYMKLGKNNFVVTFKTEKEVVEYFKMHTP